MNAIKTALRLLFKPFRDLASVLYDDLEFRAMSLPRIACFVLTATIIDVTLHWCRTGRMFPAYTELCTFTGAIWGYYTVKRWKNPPEEVAKHEHKGDVTVVGDGDKNPRPDGG